MSAARTLICLSFLMLLASWAHADSNQVAGVVTGTAAELKLLGREVIVFRATYGPYTPD
jgi:hypothetical protein